jgi:hypothetical protein
MAIHKETPQEKNVPLLWSASNSQNSAVLLHWLMLYEAESLIL